jgi:hypothetical protein
MDEKSLSAKELSFIEDDVIPHIKEFTRKGLRTKSAPVDYRYMLSSSKAWCGPNSTELDLADFNSRMTRGESDLHLWIRPIWEKNKYMSVSNCLRDYCGKVVGGLMNINMNMFATPSSKKAHMSAIMHEMIHVFAFASFLFQDFETIRPDMPNPKPIYYKCSKNQMTGKFSVEWNLPEWSPGVMMYTMTPSVVKPINVRGINASDCRCPFDPNRTYTNEDIEFCLENPHHCPVGIWTPKVVEAVRAYSGCPTLDAMELETGMPLSCASFIDPHWKMDHIGNEMMSAIDLGGPSYLSPMTLALVEDSGWYKVNYDALVSKPLERASPGYRAGCPYWRDSKCTNRLGDSSELVFCNSDKTSCSGDGLTLINCNTREKSFLLKGDECTRFTYSAAGNTENQRNQDTQLWIVLVISCPQFVARRVKQLNQNLIILYALNPNSFAKNGPM